MAVIGPSGAGKTTLLRALTGMAPATEGAVLYDHRDLYSHYAELRHRIGLVPQEDVMYPHLTPRRALGYAAELRFPGDTSDEERSVRVQEVLDELKLNQTTKDRPEPTADTPAAALSGGEKKKGQHRAGAADQAVRALPGRAHLQPGRGAQRGRRGQHEGAGPGRPYDHHGHPRPRIPGSMRPGPECSSPAARWCSTDRRTRGCAISANRAGLRCTGLCGPNRSATGRENSSGRPATSSTWPAG